MLFRRLRGFPGGHWPKSVKITTNSCQNCKQTAEKVTNQLNKSEQKADLKRKKYKIMMSSWHIFNEF